MAWRGVLAVVLCGAWMIFGTREPVSAQTAPGSQGNACGADLVKSLAGTWKAPEYKMKRASEVGTQVFGPNAFDIRNVDLTLEPSGEGVLKISTSVLDQKGKAWAPTLIEAKVTVAAPQGVPSPGTGKCEPNVTVASVEERYPDDTNYRTPLDGSRVMMATDSAAKQLEVRFETPKGAGSFWSTLVRQAPAGPPRAQRPRSSPPVQK
jgi:hypothetical protein